jgi:murein DD-endopeptidase MepM/ murein hydrolase activator NlpD
MPSVVELLRSRSRAVVLAAMAVSVAGCSADSTRFLDNPFASRSAPGEVTGSIPPAQAAPVGRVESAQLPPPAASRPAPVAAETGVAGGGRGMASYHPAPAAPAASPEVTGSVQAPVARKPAPSPQWTFDGSTAVVVAQGETIDIIARRHGMPTSAIMQANGLTAPAILHPGQRLVIPRRQPASQQASAPQAPAPAPSVPATRPVAAKVAPAAAGGTSSTIAAPSHSGVHVVVAGDTLSKISRLYHKPVGEIAKANNIQPQATLNIGDRIVIPGVRTSSVQGTDAPKSDAPKTDAPKDVAIAAPTTPVAPGTKAAAPATKGTAAAKQAAGPQPTETASMVTPAAESAAPTNSVKGAAQAAAPTFRWPVHGKVVAGFGPRPNGQQNDGINVAVPENTPVKAAEDGVVAYAGSELKGYGNLVLVRHSNGYVTAYAHAKELLVKRGDQIKRGQVIAKSGQTGNVDAPQLHFEVRKGAAPQDPMPMLNGG